MEFKTNNSTYLVDQSRKQISGGIFGDRLFDYEKVVAILGAPAVITLKNGQVVHTSTVTYRM